MTDVLVVDDSLITVKKLLVLLEGMGHTVRTAHSGEQALAACRAHPARVVTMDITMPDLDGIEATKRILAEFPGTAIIMVTSHGQEKMVIDALDAGASGYVLKPVNPEKLAQMIAKVTSQS